jgi:hypothetical protein
MNEKMKKGCGIGCGVLTILVFVIIGSIAFFVRDMSADYKAVEKSEKALTQAYGGVSGFAPPHGGLPTAERMQVFLEVRRQQSEWRRNVSLAFEEFLVKKEESASGGFTHFFRLIRSTSEMAPSLAGFWSSRNEALMEHEMGPGEYSYIYCLAYFSYLGYDPGDGAHDSELDFGGSGSGLNVSTQGDLTEAQRRDAAWRRTNDLMLPMLEAVDRTGLMIDTQEAQQWLAELDLEVGILRESPLRYPWRDGAPRLLANVFHPFRRDLEEQYDIAVNPVELIFEKVEDQTED